MGRDVGYYDRSDAFTLDFWFYAAAAYDNVPVLNHLAEQNSGRTGYRLTINDGKLWASLAHSPPANMIAIETEDVAAGRRVDAYHAHLRRLEPRSGLAALLQRHTGRDEHRARFPDALDPAVHLGRRVRSVRGSRRRHAFPREGARRQRHRRAARFHTRSHARRDRVLARRRGRRIARSRNRACRATDGDRRARRRGAQRIDDRASTRERARDERAASPRDGRRARADADVRAEPRRLQRPRRARAPEGPRRRARVGSRAGRRTA